MFRVCIILHIVPVCHGPSRGYAYPAQRKFRGVTQSVWKPCPGPAGPGGRPGPLPGAGQLVTVTVTVTRDRDLVSLIWNLGSLLYSTFFWLYTTLAI